MTTLHRYVCPLTLTGVCLLVGTAAYAQVSSINSVFLQPRAFNDVPGATLTSVNNYPTLVSFTETGVSAPTGFANRDVWQLSSNGGTSPYLFQNTDHFRISVDLTLTGSPISPRKEAGFLFSTVSNGDIQFIVNTDGHEVVQFGGISFYSFNAAKGITYNSGDKITLQLAYYTVGDGLNALMFSANGVDSPAFVFPGGGGIGNGSTLGGYFQIVNDPTNPNNSGSATFANLNVTIPEPSTLALAGLGLLSLVLRRRV